MAWKTNNHCYMRKMRILDVFWRSLLIRKLVALVPESKRDPFH